MSLFGNPEDLRLLQNLLNPQQRQNDEDSDTDEDDAETMMMMKQKMSNALNPGNIAPANDHQQNLSKKKAQFAKIDEKPGVTSIEEWEALQGKEDAGLLETRKSPEYKISYRQAVGTQDVYLQMGNRSNATASCEDLILVIELPDESSPASKMSLSITDSEIDLATPVYRLKMALPHCVDVDRCTAKYEADERRLCMQMRLKRELDFVNF